MPRLAALVLLCAIPLSVCACAGGAKSPSGNPDSSVDRGRDLRLDLNADLQVCLTEAGTSCYAESCGNSAINPGESCDDGNARNGDGCSAACQTEHDWECPVPGEDCVSTMVCSDKAVTGNETCDDGNKTPADGCNADCQIEDGWTCPVAGLRCQPICGDGKRLGWEECDDDNLEPKDGCSELCRREPGWACGADGSCHKTVCGDITIEGDESCDDGNTNGGDGCGPSCISEPTCAGTSGCTSRCGDGLKFPSEECDDGNANSSDGCSADCKLESASWDCKQVSNGDGNQLVVAVTYRDFMSYWMSGGHPDFNRDGVACSGMVQTTLDAARKPVMVPTRPACATSAGQAMTDSSFGQWYTDSPLGKAIVSSMTFTKLPDGTFVYNNSAQWDPVTSTMAPSFFPVDNLGWSAPGEAGASDVSGGHNFGFTSEVRYWFEYKGGETLNFTGDDDVWVFINGILAVDIGGIHVPTEGSVTLDTATATNLGLTAGNIYEIVVFQAERHPGGSSYKLTLGNFQITRTVCTPTCGDGVVNGTELCDDGVNDGSYGGCKASCQLGPYCGDGNVDPDHEACDNGVNRTSYNQDGCAPGCRVVPRCGDGNIDSLWGETCDDGNTSDGDGCSSSCQLDIG